MKTSKLFKTLSLATAITISSFGMWLVNQESASAVQVAPSGWCIHAGSYIVYGNFDGKDGRDALCADTQGNKWINYADGDTWYKKSSWCTHSGARIYAVSLEQQDHREDLECIDSENHVWHLSADKYGHFPF